MVPNVVKRALIVEDDPEWLSRLLSLVERAGYSATTADSYESGARQLAGDEVPDLVVVDLRLLDRDRTDPGGLGGLGLLVDLHEQGQLKTGIVVTGKPDTGTRTLARQLGIDYFDKAAFSMSEFREAMSRRSAAQGDPTKPSSDAVQVTVLPCERLAAPPILGRRRLGWT